MADPWNEQQGQVDWLERPYDDENDTDDDPDGWEE